jgi:NADPH:quinone reductase
LHAVRVHQPGGLEAMVYEEVRTPEPAPGTVLIKIAAAGVNFIDTYQRSGLYPLPTPFTLGVEGAGTVVAVGDGVAGYRPGDRVTWISRQLHGSYAEYAVVPAARLVPVPDGVDLKQAAAVMTQGVTAYTFVNGVRPLQPGDTALIHAAAGGTGQMLVRMAKMRGAHVIGTVSTAEKEQVARQAGADEVIRYSEVDFETEARRLTGGRGVDVVFDGVGKDTFEKSLACLRRRGMMVLFGNASGPVPPVNPLLLGQKGSLYLTRPMVFDYVEERAELLENAGAVLAMVGSGRLPVHIDRELKLSQAAEAHRLLQGRETTGKLLLTP